MSEFRDLTRDEAKAAGVGQYDYVLLQRCICGYEYPYHEQLKIDDGHHETISEPCPNCGCVYRLVVQVQAS